MSALATKYTYTLERCSGGVLIVLTRTADSATKQFTVAGGALSSLQGHMNSLTDACCEGFFPTERTKPSKASKPAATAPSAPGAN